ncbi:protocatechuate 3,4-dioxygenase subunit alpha [Haliscomenobacter hydrossis]|uniref:Protocatechuate 3,4-dioxygenase, alpha subunit n=1 Tax=Haliscomenobacter hydrossis (strain ATCC 27775 / DSM 1100 / LMG 10767 / O) TaxID=760192 RepID=F4L198_HALH1|nr:protocatechuate 3,4-dioxygenase, alpha subunit [Haliscomenobacter hydrossis DSM 1100]
MMALPTSSQNTGEEGDHKGSPLQTPSQTVGPYFAYGLTAAQYLYDFDQIANDVLVGDDTPGERIHIVGRVFDGENNLIPDAMIEVWQPDIKAFGRMGTGTDPKNRFLFETVKPQSMDGQAPHLALIVLMRGLLVHAYTRIYFSDEAATNAQDAVLNSVPRERRHTLIAQRHEMNGRTEYHFDIYMQGEVETVFFDV